MFFLPCFWFIQLTASDRPVSGELAAGAQPIPAFCFQGLKLQSTLYYLRRRGTGDVAPGREKKIWITGKSLPKPGEIKGGQRALENGNLHLGRPWGGNGHALWTFTQEPQATRESVRVSEPEPEEVMQAGAGRFMAMTKGSGPTAGEWTPLTCDITERFWKLGSIPELGMRRVAKSDRDYTAHIPGAWVLTVDRQLTYTK